MNLGRYALGNEVFNCSIFDFVTDKPFMYMDYANSSENAWTADQSYATGGAGSPRRVVFNSNKQSTLTLETQIFSMQHLAMYTGKDIESGVGKNIFKREVLTVTDNAGTLQVTLTKTPIDTNGDSTVDKDDVAIFAFANGIDGAECTIGTVTTGTKVVTITAGAVANDEVAVYYQWATTSEAHRITFTPTDFPKYVKIIADTMMTDELAGDLVAGQLAYYKASIQPSLTFRAANSGDPTSLSMVFDIFPTKVNGIDVMAEFTIYED